MPLDPETGIIMFIVGGIGTLVSFTAFKVAQQLGPEISAGDLLPALPPHPPIPRFMIEKPELLAELRGK